MSGQLSVVGALGVCLGLFAWCGTAAARPQGVVEGPAAVVDGDTLTIGAVRVRLEGIDAPEAGQQCRREDGEAWPCGTAATRLLVELVAGQTVACQDVGLDKYGRTLGHCTAGGRDLNAEMVRRGLAWAFVKYSRAYVEAEAEARTLRLGVWQAETDPAWVYRESRWRAEASAAPEGCAIKGNVGRNGRLYHVPWGPWYGRTQIDERRGERWFCSEAEAMAAGWRPAEHARAPR